MSCIWEIEKSKLSDMVHKTKRTLDYIHLDLWDPSLVASKAVRGIY